MDGEITKMRSNGNCTLAQTGFRKAEASVGNGAKFGNDCLTQQCTPPQLSHVEQRALSQETTKFGP